MANSKIKSFLIDLIPGLIALLVVVILVLLNYCCLQNVVLVKAEAMIEDYVFTVGSQTSIIQEQDQLIKELTDENERLKQHVDVKVEENVQLRQTVKTLSSRGSVRPKNFELPPLATKEDLEKSKVYLGEFKLSFYTPSSEECGNDNGITASGAAVMPGYTVATDPKVIPLGSELYIEGYGFMKAMDTGGAIKGNKIDICLFDKKVAKKSGIQIKKVWLVE